MPTASHAVFRDREEAAAHIACASYPAVLKADVLAAGKGVIIAADEREARAALDVFFGERRFGETEVVLEEFLEGEELSLLALCDGERARAAGARAGLQAHLRRRRGPQHRRDGQLLARARARPRRARERSRAASHQPIVDELRAQGTPFHGVLYAGLMMTADGPKVLEYNARFGDPETQAVLPRLRSDLLELLDASTRPGGLAGVEPSGRRLGGDRGARLARVPGVVVERRPDQRPRRGRGRRGLPRGDGPRDGEFVTSGGRVLDVTALGATAADARDRAYAAVDRIDFDGRQVRRDIAARAVGRDRVAP